MSRSLVGISSLYLDANILIYLVEGNVTISELVLAAFREIEAHNITLYTSEITVTECLNGAYQVGLEELAQKYLELLGTEDFITLLPVDLQVCIEAARISAEHRLKTADSLHLATAAVSGCQAFLTNDSAFGAGKTVEVVQLAEFKTP